MQVTSRAVAEAPVAQQRSVRPRRRKLGRAATITLFLLPCLTLYFVFIFFPVIQTTADRERRLRDAGASDADLARIHAPCGLDIGSRTAEETAVSVLAEIIASRAHRAGASLRATRGPIHGRDAPR